MPEETMQKVEQIIADLEKPTEDLRTRDRHIKEAYGVFSKINELEEQHRGRFVERLKQAAMTHTRMQETLALINAIENTRHPSRVKALEELNESHPTEDGKNFADISLKRVIRER